MSDPPLSEVGLKMACVCTTLNFFFEIFVKEKYNSMRPVGCYGSDGTRQTNSK